MKAFSMKKYKDDLPLKTIAKIRKILNDAGILTIETLWRNSADGYYSVHLTIQNTSLATNGKGTTYEYALASAYGEMMERLQNQALFRLNRDLNPEVLPHNGFYYAPDEKKMSLEEVLNSEDDWLKTQMSQIKPDIDKRALLRKWQLVSYEDIPSDFIALPYFGLKNKRLSYIPIKMVLKMYMSNGMCAGNTAEEALVQGLSEILEREANKRILKERIVPPTIPREYLKNFARIDGMIASIESNGNFEIIMKDCSLGKGYPIVGAIFINKDDQTYFVKFGAHPVFEIAAERTLTELLQGQEVKNMMGATEFCYKQAIEDEYLNLLGILTCGAGYYPIEIFSQKCSYEFKEFADVTPLNNKEMLMHLVNLLEKNGYEIFVRDVSYLGLPSFHVIVPGMSQVETIDDMQAADEYAEFNRIKRYVRNLSQASIQEIQEIINFMNKVKPGNAVSVMELLNIPIQKGLPWYYTNIILFKTALSYKIGDFTNAYTSFNDFLQFFRPNACDKSQLTYYKCVRDYIGTRIDGLEEKDSIAILSVFYPPQTVYGVINDFSDPQQIFKYGLINCWNCDTCEFKKCCSYDEMEKVYKVIKDKRAASNIDQNNLKQLVEL